VFGTSAGLRPCSCGDKKDSAREVTSIESSTERRTFLRDRLCAVLAWAMTLEEVLQKFDLGAAEHNDEDLAKLNALEALKQEVAHGLCYTAFRNVASISNE
jgi:hypothetical protein